MQQLEKAKQADSGPDEQETEEIPALDEKILAGLREIEATGARGLIAELFSPTGAARRPGPRTRTRGRRWPSSSTSVDRKSVV